MKPTTYPQLLQYLQDELAVSTSAIKIAEQQIERDQAMLPIALWQKSFITTDQFAQIFDWLAVVET